MGALVLLAACGGGGASAVCRPPPDFPPGITRGPMLALATPTTMTIAWGTDEAVVGSVAYGLDDSYGTVVAEDAPAHDHEITLVGLAPASTWHYRILCDGLPAGGDHVFTTPPTDPFAPVRFAVLGDSGTGCPPAFAVVTRLEEEAPDFVLHTGDLAYRSGTPLEVLHRFTVPFARVVDHRPLYAVLGNHDVKTRGGSPLLDAVVLPRNSVDGSEKFYAFDWGACHVIALDSNQALGAGSPQRTWLEADLAASNARWTFAFLHHPVYSSSSHGGRPDLVASLPPLFESGGVDVVFCGHDHDYERTFPLAGGVPVDATSEPHYVDPGGVVYVVTGGGGADLYPSATSAFTAHSESSFHVTVAQVEGDTLVLEAVGVDGMLMDRMEITKSP